MDFGRPMIRTPGIVARSGIRLVSETHLGDDPLDVGVCRAANEAARDLLLGNDRASGDDDGGADAGDGGGRTENDGGMRRRRALALALVDSSLYRERHLPPPTRLIRSGDLVVVFESFNDLNFVYATPGDVFSNRNGHFHHDDFIGHPYGCKIRSRNGGGMGFLYLLRPTPELWTRSLPHRTQIVHELDASMIVHYLDVGPDMVVCESGTGSGAMSHALLRSISPSGMLHTYEFNRMRAEKARMEFTGHGLGHLVEVHHRDVCGSESGRGGGVASMPMIMGSKKKKGKKKKRRRREDDGSEAATTTATAGDSDDDEDDDDDDDDGDAKNEDGAAGDGEEDDGRGGFRLGPAIAHAIFLDLPEPWLAVPHAAYAIRPNGRICSYSPCVEQTQRTCSALRANGFHSLRTVEARLREFFVSEVDLEMPPALFGGPPPDVLTEERASLERERCANGGGGGGAPTPATTTTTSMIEDGDGGGVGGGIRATTAMGGGGAEMGPVGGGGRRKANEKKMLCARPFAQMRGHTAFLTFATAGNAPRPDPNENLVRK
jgi:tRNA A58 N-methylase Trm61